MKTKTMLILGGRSDVGLAIAYHFAKIGYSIQLAARKVNSLAPYQSDIKLRHNVSVKVFEFDALNTSNHEKFIDKMPVLADITVCAVGVLGKQTQDEKNIGNTIHVMRSNYEGPASIFAVIANRYQARGYGTLIGISSVAGERGRANNYIYGSAKAAYTTFLSGLRNRLAKKGVNVITVLPGFIDSKMTDGLKLPALLTAKPSDVATAIERAVKRKKDVVYVKPIWQPIMLVIRNIPEFIFKKLKI